MATNVPALCLDGPLPVPSGYVIKLEPTTPTPAHAHQTAAIDGIVQIHPAADAAGARRVKDALLREHPATIARMVTTIPPEAAARISRDKALADTTHDGIYLDLPGRTDLLDADDDRFIPLNAAREIVDPAVATVVRVIPERHLLADLPDGRNMAGAPLYKPMKGQMRLRPDSVELGLPHGVLVASGSEHLAAPTGLDQAIAVGGYLELLSHLDHLAVGEKAELSVVDASGATRTFTATMTPIGLGVVAPDGTAASLPRRPVSIAVALPLPAEARAFDELIERVPASSADDAAACVTGMRGVARAWYAAGVRPPGTTEDPGGRAGTLTRSGDPLSDPFASVADSLWTRVASWERVAEDLSDGRADAAFVLIGRPGAAGHAVSLRLVDGRLRFAHFNAGAQGTVGSDPSDLPALVDARALRVDGAGRVVPAEAVMQSQSQASALVDRGLVGDRGEAYAGKGKGKERARDDSPAQSKRTRVSSSQSLMTEVRAEFDRNRQVASFDFYGRTSARVRIRLPRDYAPTLTDPQSRVGQSLRHLSIAVGNKIKSLGIEGDYETQTLLINKRLVIATNASKSLDALLTEYSSWNEEADWSFIDFIEAELVDAGYFGDRAEKQRRLGDSLTKLRNSISGERPPNAVTDVLAGIRKIVDMDTSSHEDILRTVLADDDYSFTLIFMKHSNLPSWHAEQALAYAIQMAGLTSRHIHGDYAIHGKQHPCEGCAMVLDMLAERHRRHHDYLVASRADSRLTANYKAFHSNPNFGAYYVGALGTAFRIPGFLPDGNFTVDDPLTRARRIIARGVSYSGFSHQGNPGDAIIGPAPTYGLELRRSQAEATVYNFETPSDSDGDGKKRPLGTDPITGVKLRGMADETPRVVRQDLSADPDVLALKALVKHWKENSVDPKSKPPAGFTRLVKQVHGKTQNAKEVAELVPDVGRTTVEKYIKAKDWEKDDIWPLFTREMAADFTRRLGRAIPAEWRNDKTYRRSENLRNHPRLLAIFKEMVGLDISRTWIAEQLDTAPTNIPRWEKAIGKKLPASYVDDLKALKEGRVPPVRIPGWQAPTAQTTGPALAFRPAPSATTSASAAHGNAAAQETFADELTDPLTEIAGVKYYADRTGIFGYNDDGTKVYAPGPLATMIRSHVSNENAGSNRAAPAPASSAYVRSLGSSVAPPTIGARAGLPPHYRGDGWEYNGTSVEPLAYYDRPNDTHVRGVPGRRDMYEYHDSQAQRWVTQQYVNGRWGPAPSDVQHFATPALPLVPFAGDRPQTHMLPGNAGVIIDSPGARLIELFGGMVTPKDTFAVIGRGLSAGQARSGGIAHTDGTFLTIDHLLALIPPGARNVGLLNCDAASSGLLNAVHRRRPELGLTGADKDLYGVAPQPGSAVPATFFTAVTDWGGGVPTVQLSESNQFQHYPPGSALDAEPVAVGTVLPGTPAPTAAHLTAAGRAAASEVEQLHVITEGLNTSDRSEAPPEPQWLRDSLARLARPDADTPNLLSDMSVPGIRATAPPRDLVMTARRHPDQHFVWLSTKPGQATEPAILAWLNERLEQFAQARRTPIVFTSGATSGLLDVTDVYGAAVAHEVPHSSGGLSGLNLDNSWTLVGADTTWRRISSDLAEAAQRAARPTAAVKQVSEAFGAWVWGTSNIRERFRSLSTQPELLTDASKQQAAEMARRVPTSMNLALAKPMLSFGPSENLVVQLTEAPPQKRPRVLLQAFGRLDRAGKLEDPQQTGGAANDFVDLVQAVRLGAAETEQPVFDFTVSLLKVLGLVKAHRLTDAEQFIEENRGRLTPEQKAEFVDGLDELKGDMADATERTSLNDVLAAVYVC